MKARTSHKCVFIFTVLFFLIFSSLMVNYAENNTEMKLDLPEEPRAAGKTARQTIETNKTFMNFTTDGCNGTFIEDRNVTLAWQPPQTEYQMDDDTLLLTHLENNFDGEDGEKRRGYIRSYKNLAGLWKFDEGIGTSTFDGSGHENHGTIISGASWIDGIYGKALSFDGVDDFVSIGSGVSSYIGNEITVSAWVYSNTLAQPSTSRAIVTEAYTTDSNIEFELFLSGSNHFLTVGFFDGTWHQVSEGTNFTLNQWSYVAATYDGHYLRLFRNGNEVATSSDLNLALPNGVDGWRVGRRHDHGDPGDMWNGKIDEVSIYSRAKSADEIKTDYDQQMSDYIPFETGKFVKGIRIEGNNTLAYHNGMPIDSDCVGFWRFNEGAGNSINDSSGNGNLGKLVNGTAWINGKSGKALNFDGSNDWVDCGNDISLQVGGSDFTISAWINFPGAGGIMDVVGKRIPYSPNTGWVWHVTPTVTRLWTSAYGGIDYNYDFNYDTWYHIVMIRDKINSKVTYYINGQRQITVTGESADLSNTGKLAIGRLSEEDDQYFNGKIDELAIYKSIRTPEEIYGSYKSINSFDIKKGSLELWVKPNWSGGDGENHTIFFSGKSWNNNSFFILKDSDNFLKFITADNETNYQGFPKVKVSDWKKNNWYHLAFTWDSDGNKNIYINGYLKSTVTNNPMPTIMHSSLSIGTPPEGFGSFNGVIDELRISDRIRTTDELRNYHELGIYESNILDVGEPVAWENIEWNAEVPLNTELYLQTRTSDDNSTWTKWSGNTLPSDLELGVYFANTGETINASHSRYLQWRAVLKSADGIYTPKLYNVTITWNHLPKAINVNIAPVKPTINDELVIEYDYSDLDDDIEGTTTFDWMVDRGTGVFISSGINTQNLASRWTEFNEKWFCRITPHDGKNYGFPVDSSEVKIAKGNITKIVIMPSFVEVSADDTVQFSAKALDSDNNEITVTFNWYISGGGTIDQTGLFSPETTGLHFVYASSEEVYGAAMVTVTPGKLHHILITPDYPKITTDDTIEFEATFHDAENNTMMAQNITWNVTGGGTIDPKTGIFDATTSGEFSVSASANNTTGYTTINIRPGAPDRLNLTPKNPTITADDQLQFDVEAFDEDNNELTTDFEWLAENGEITSNGLFKPSKTGKWKVSVRFNVSGIETNTTITVLHGELTNLALDPVKHIMSIEDEISFTTIGSDAKGNQWTDVKDVKWLIDKPSLGAITQDGTFKAENSGSVSVTAEVNSTTRANGDTIMGVASITISTDGDNDGMLDEWERQYSLNFKDEKDANYDEDGDGLTNIEEFENGTSPQNSDSDNDGYSDREEVKKGSDPNDDSDHPDIKAQQESEQLMYWIIIIILIIIILVVLLASRRRKKPEKEAEEEPWDKEEEEEEEELEEVEEEELEEEEPEEEEPEDEEIDLEAEPEAEFKLEEPAPEEEEDLIDFEMPEEKPVKKKVPIKGKMPKKGKIPIKGKLPKKEKKVIEPEHIDTEHEFAPQIVKLEDKSVVCGVCLGAIKTGLMAIKCWCGKYYHESCGVRVGECPRCERKFKIEKLAEMKEEEVEELEEMEEKELTPEEFEKQKDEKKKAEREKVAKILSGLEERLAAGEISESTYLILRKKYEK